MVKIEIGDKKYEMPESFDEVTLIQYCRAFHNLPKVDESLGEDEKVVALLRNEAIILSRLLGEKDDFMLSQPIGVFNRLREQMKFIYKSVDYLDAKIFYVKIKDKKYFMPDPSEMSLRQYIDTDIILRENNSPEQFCELLAALLLPVDEKTGKTKEYDGDYQKRFEIIKNMSCADTLPFIYTFLKKNMISKQVSKMYSQVVEENQHHRHIENS